MVCNAKHMPIYTLKYTQYIFYSYCISSSFKRTVAVDNYGNCHRSNMLGRTIQLPAIAYTISWWNMNECNNKKCQNLTSKQMPPPQKKHRLAMNNKWIPTCLYFCCHFSPQEINFKFKLSLYIKICLNDRYFGITEAEFPIQ